MSSFIRELIKLFPDQKDVFTRFELDRIKVFGLYISREEVILSENDKLLFNQLTFVQPQTFNYFQWIVQAIKHSARNEIFCFLGLRNEQIGMVKSSSEDTNVDGAGHRQPMEKIGGLEGNCQLVLPKEMNSICVIDGSIVFMHIMKVELTPSKKDG